MDKTDIVLIMHLLNNSRLSNRELAEKLNLSVNAVHKRIQALRELGVIRKFTARVHLYVDGGLIILIFGVSAAHSVDNLPEKLHKNNCVYWVALAGGGYVYVGGYLKNLSDLEPFVEFVTEESQLRNPSVGIVSPPIIDQNVLAGFQQGSVSMLDRKIIRSMHDDSRKAITDIAAEVGVSVKTVRRRLTYMMEHYLIDLSLEWYPDASNDIITVLHLSLRADAEKKNVPKVLSKYMPNLLFYWSFSNLPNQWMAVFWTNTMKELKEIQEGLAKDDLFESIVPNILYVGYIFETWRDDLLHP